MAMLIGAHVPTQDPLAEAEARDADLAQVFLSPPQSWKTPKERDDAAALAASAVPVYVHAPYIINVATTNNRVRHPSRQNLTKTVRAAEAIGAAGVIVHGGHVQADDDADEGFDNWRKTLDRLETSIPILIENTAGGNNAMSRHVDRIAGLFEALDGTRTPFGLCLDTCHLHAAGEDLSDAVERVVAATGPIQLVHLNDSRDVAGSGADRHTNLGQGEIEEELLVEVVRAANAPVVVETPGDAQGQGDDIAWIRKRLG